jgi:hypothetical protein
MPDSTSIRYRARPGVGLSAEAAADPPTARIRPAAPGERLRTE